MARRKFSGSSGATNVVSMPSFFRLTLSSVCAPRWPDPGFAPRAGRASRSRICGPPSAAEVLLRRLLGLGGRGGLLALGARRPAVFRGRHADLVQEKAREVALRGEAKLGRDLADLAAARGKPRDRRLDAQHVEVDARREAGAELEEIVEAR